MMGKSRYVKGLSIIEFTIVSTVLLLLLFGILELSRFVFSLQMLNEVTRKAARLAAVCEVEQGSVIPSLSSITSVAPDGYKENMLKIDYLDQQGNVIYSGTGAITNDEFLDIKFIRAKIEGFNFGFSLLPSLLTDSVSIPSFETILPAESLGIYRPESDGSVPSSPNCK
ncbi:TadE/TadG family type IV pilus assembly protein [Vibrio rarus]|uniref:TadE/TadG family type IV pilus assembly protein n=1 Tax=Vibrio rarus TaxID=413403 RepID=UPI0021C43BF4|nr:TadE/TadG family type IV pilus assembly protein [Vibrio rarus]